MAYIGNVSGFDSVDTEQLVDSAVTTSKLVDASVTTSKILDDAVTTAKIPDSAITAAKIDPSVSLGGPSLGTNSVIRTNAKVIAEDITFAGNENGMSIGPITINSGNTVLVASGSTWVIL